MELLTKMLKIYSPSGQEGELASFLHSEMNLMGYHTKIDEVGNLVGKIGNGQKEVLLVGHMDTVEGKLSVKLSDDVIYARGSVDAKASLATFIQAASKFKNQKKLTIRVIGAVEEEASSRGAHYLKKRYNPDYVIIGEPSGWDGVTLGYRGALGVNYSLEKPLVHRGHQNSLPAEEAVSFYNKLKDRYCPKDEGFTSISMRLTHINTKTDPFKESVTMNLNVRLPLSIDLAEMKDYISGIRGNAAVNFTHETEAIKAEKRNDLVRAFLQSIRGQGGAPKFKLKTGTSDMNILGNAWAVPIVAYGPGDSSLDHTPDEHLNLEEYNRSKKVLVGVLNRLAKRQADKRN